MFLFEEVFRKPVENLFMETSSQKNIKIKKVTIEEKGV